VILMEIDDRAQRLLKGQALAAVAKDL